MKQKTKTNELIDKIKNETHNHKIQIVPGYSKERETQREEDLLFQKHCLDFLDEVSDVDNIQQGNDFLSPTKMEDRDVNDTEPENFLDTSPFNVDYDQAPTFITPRMSGLLEKHIESFKKSEEKDTKTLNMKLQEISSEEYNWKQYNKRLSRSSVKEILSLFETEYETFETLIQSYMAFWKK